MAEAVYVLCALTSIACAVLLLANYRRTKARLLLWSGVCFAGLALNNVLLVTDLVIVPSIDLSLLRRGVRRFVAAGHADRGGGDRSRCDT